MLAGARVAAALERALAEQRAFALEAEVDALAA
jgi:hypothetical protein